MRKLFRKIFNKSPKHIPIPKVLNAYDGLKTLIEAKNENHRISEEQKTFRENIRANRDIEIERIKTQKEIMLNYFDNIFSERRNSYKKFFEMLDKGIETNNMELIKVASTHIVSIAMNSPLKDLEKFKSQNNELGKEVKKIDNFTL